eukprot:TRINITY_DN29726_c0_g1_i1.p1 TRINITY_DN29726_c0_g1~~TRINITY_DN29726_c0_g1_i1.p1  ORF type:complete len:460 (+),score=69.07 TRINITY_DN29726_c0_g1_i1:175-1554(+)
MGMLSDVLRHPDEFLALLRVRYVAYLATRLPSDPSLAFCFDMLNRVSRSFAVVIQQLSPELRTPVCVFYLVLRALDTVEDDMAIPIEEKLPILRTFFSHLNEPNWRFICGTKDYRRLMQEWDHVAKAFMSLDEMYRNVIEDITKRMGLGMAKFIEKEVETVAEYDEYCGYVAGLVGVGLSDLFVAAGREKPVEERESYSMGLFLQKTNIIRDYLEDINEEPAPRMFWPREIWGKHAKELADFKQPDSAGPAVVCLNELVTDALRHADDCLTYLAKLTDRSVFRFCAIPQIMAMGTLAQCYNNVGVFQGVVKMRRGLSARIMDGTSSMDEVYQAFAIFAKYLQAKISDADPSAKETRALVDTIQRRCQARNLACKSGEVVSIKTPTTNLRMKILWALVSCVIAVLLGLPRLRKQLNIGQSEAVDKALQAQDTGEKTLVVLLMAVGVFYVLFNRKTSIASY